MTVDTPSSASLQAAARARVHSSVKRIVYAVVFAAAIAIVLGQIWLPLAWLIGVGLSQSLDRFVASLLLRLPAEEGQGHWAGRYFGAALGLSALVFAMIYFPLGLQGGPQGRLLIVLLAACALLNCVIYMHQTPNLMWPTAAPHLVGIFLPALLQFSQSQTNAWAMVSVLLVTGVFVNLLVAGYRHNRQMHANLERARGLAEQGQRDAERRREEAEAANQAKSSFLARMSHELRTPLNAIIGFSELIQEEARDVEPAPPVSDMAKHAARIEIAGRHLLALINDVLDLSRIEAGRMDMQQVEIDLHQLIEELEITMRPLAARNGNALKVELMPGAARSMFADSLRVRQCLLNLLSNACKFTRDGVVELRIHETGGSQIEFAVHDTGPGISPEIMARLFRPFEQGDASVTRRFEGSGLGLAITRELAQLMGGNVACESQPGQGSCFRLRLPTAGPGSLAA